MRKPNDLSFDWAPVGGKKITWCVAYVDAHGQAIVQLDDTETISAPEARRLAKWLTRWADWRESREKEN